jgi:hypothetical protein
MSYYDRTVTLKALYIDFFPIIVTATTGIGFVAGLLSCGESRFNSFFTQMIGYTSIGFITGITYPISCPLIGGYVLYKNQKR